MVNESDSGNVANAMRLINQAWLQSRVGDMEAAVHPDIVLVVPGFAGRARGRDGFLAGFRDFTQNATIHDFRELDQQIDVVGDTAVISFAYEMRFELSGAQYRVTGRDLWVFQRQGSAWVAVWRTMLDVNETPA
jgi:hypothetical protein